MGFSGTCDGSNDQRSMLMPRSCVSCSAHALIMQNHLLQGGKDTQILHTNSEDVSSDSPTQAKVEEQSSHKVQCQRRMC